MIFIVLSPSIVFFSVEIGFAIATPNSDSDSTILSVVSQYFFLPYFLVRLLIPFLLLHIPNNHL